MLIGNQCCIFKTVGILNDVRAVGVIGNRAEFIEGEIACESPAFYDDPRTRLVEGCDKNRKL